MRFKHFVALIIVFFAFQNISAQIKSGGFFFNQSTSGYTLNKDNGKRSVEVFIEFNKEFDTKPNVFLSITVIDAVSDTKLRFAAEPIGVSRRGFIAKVSVWGDTKLNGIGGNWLAEATPLKLVKEEIKVGTTIQLNNIEFDFNKATLKAASNKELDKVAKFLTDNKTIVIELAGHTDNVGAKDYNKKLSQERADAVKVYMVSKGIAGNRMVSKGYGMDRPIESNASQSGRERNRRVEFTILEK